ncbi:MAG: sodium/hydrogen exchanger family/TrkA domain protein [bacterium]|nr:MAG: sodium/hydrogen exchanger family/TrkA domain protein [bacterium]
MEQVGYLRDLLIIFACSAVVVYFFDKIKIPSVVGFMISGVFLGPHGLSLIRDLHLVELLAQIGVALLLFTVGLEFSMTKIFQLRKIVFFGGGLQVLLTCGAVSVIAHRFTDDWNTSIFIGFLVALSSSAVVLKLLLDKAEINTMQGQNITGILIFQDLCVVPMMILAPALAGHEITPAVLTPLFIKSTALILSLIIGTRWIVPNILSRVVETRNRELFIIVILLLCLGTAYVTFAAGLSLALGAFLAGMMISDSEYSHQVVSEILPFRDALNSLFFVSIGMLLDLSYVVENPGVVIAVTLGIFFIKFPLAALPSIILRYPLRFAVITGISLAQIGEFSFVLAWFGMSVGIDMGGFYQPFITAAIMTMAMTPFMMEGGRVLCDTLLEKVLDRGGRKRPSEKGEDEYNLIRDHVIIVGFGLNGKNLARVLRDTGVPYNILELNPATVRRYSRLGEQIHYGDATRDHVLKHVGVESARLFVLAISDPTMERRIVQTARRLNSRLHIIARTRFVSEIEPLKNLGADEVIPEEFETSIEIFAHVLRVYDVPRNIVLEQIDDIRSSEYGMLRSLPEERILPSQDFPFSEKLEWQMMQIPPGAESVGGKLADLNIRAVTGATVLAVQREDEFSQNPASDFIFRVGDMVYLVGKDEQVRDAIKLFQKK